MFRSEKALVKKLEFTFNFEIFFWNRCERNEMCRKIQSLVQRCKTKSKKSVSDLNIFLLGRDLQMSSSASNNSSQLEHIDNFQASLKKRLSTRDRDPRRKLKFHVIFTSANDDKFRKSNLQWLMQHEDRTGHFRNCWECLNLVRSILPTHPRYLSYSISAEILGFPKNFSQTQF